MGKQGQAAVEVDDAPKTNPFSSMMDKNKATGPKGSDFKFNTIVGERPPELVKAGIVPVKKAS